MKTNTDCAADLAHLILHLPCDFLFRSVSDFCTIYVSLSWEIEKILIFTVLFSFSNLKGILCLGMDGYSKLQLEEKKKKTIAKNSVQFSAFHLPLSKKDSNLFCVRLVSYREAAWYYKAAE